MQALFDGHQVTCLEACPTFACMEVQEYMCSTCVKDDSMAAEERPEGPALLFPLLEAYVHMNSGWRGPYFSSG